jgi:hypothetical protein
MIYLFTVTCNKKHIFYYDGYIYACGYNSQFDEDYSKFLWIDIYSDFVDDNINPEIDIEKIDISQFLPEKLILVEHGGSTVFFANLYNKINKLIYDISFND